ncbi:trypsin-like serine peptidase [Glycomyces artemisiae]|uniref:trypsin-like serine peptidase n=1 Tax=Glycomyces artemisiae TaxID=1076443 RepID=UPI0011B26406|nr:serine protease [Glycomyces artemisiae]
MASNRTKRTVLAFTASAFAAAAVLMATPAAAAETPGFRADQIAQTAPADIGLQAGVKERIAHDDAAFIKVRFDDVALGARDTITVARPDGGESREYGPADVADGGLWALSVEGDAAEVVLNDLPDGTEAAARVAEYSRGLNDAELDARPAADEPSPESICGKDDSRSAPCYRDSEPLMYDAAQSVARLIIDGESYCTGWKAGYNRFLTNNHCFSSGSEARSTEVQFGFECVECGEPETRDPIKVSGASVLATDYTLDFTLFTVDDPEAVADLPALPIATGGASENEKVFIPGHPAGKPKRIAADSSSEQQGSRCQVLDPAVHGRGWNTDLDYLCDTEGGSSGSPVIDRSTGEVVGLHHLGGCPNQAVRMDRVWPYIRGYLADDYA